MDVCHCPNLHFHVLGISITTRTGTRDTGIRGRRWKMFHSAGRPRGGRTGSPIRVSRFRRMNLVLRRALPTGRLQPDSVPVPLEEGLEPGSVLDVLPHGVPRFLAQDGRTRETGWVVGFDRIHPVGGGPLGVLLGAAVGHGDWSCPVETGVIDLTFIVITEVRHQRGQTLTPLDLIWNVGCPDLDQRSRSLDGSLEYDDHLKVERQHRLCGQIPEGAGRCDPVSDRDGPEEKDETVRYTGLRDEFEGVLAEGDQFALRRQAALDEEGSDRRPDDVRLAEVTYTEDEVVEAVAHADDGVVTEDDRLNEETEHAVDIFRTRHNYSE